MANQEQIVSRKRQKTLFSDTTAGGPELFETLPDDLVLSILGKLSSTSTSPSDFISVLMTYVLNKPFNFFFPFFST